MSRLPVVLGLLVLGLLFFALAVLSTFSALYSLHVRPGLDAGLVVLLTAVGGAGAILTGYGSVRLLGGRFSLRAAGLLSRATRTRQVVAPVEPAGSPGTAALRRARPLFLPPLVFLMTLALAWDVYNIHDPRTAALQPLFHFFNIFARPVGTNPVVYSVELIPSMLALLALAGAAPALALPYLGRFQVIGVNTSPFHIRLLMTAGGLILGLGVLFTLTGLLYNILWMSRGPPTAHYALLALAGFSLHYTLGARLGVEGAERDILRRLQGSSSGPVVLGSVSVNPTGRAPVEVSGTRF